MRKEGDSNVARIWYRITTIEDELEQLKSQFDPLRLSSTASSELEVGNRVYLKIKAEIDYNTIAKCEKVTKMMVYVKIEN